MDAAQWPQQVGFTRSMEEIITSNNPTQPPPPQHQHQHQHQQQDLDGNNQRKVRPQKDQIVNCPRCNSTNTKFCYYNNYSLTQPRYFCKTCRRYWTQGGSLRNVPVGGGSRKNKRSNPQTSSSSSSPSKLIPDLNPPASFLIPPHNHLHHQNPSYKIHNHGQDLNLAFPTSTMLQSMEFPKIESSGDLVDRSTRSPNNTTTAPASTSTPISSMELLRAPVICSSGLGSAYVQVPMSVNSNALYNSSSGFLNLHEMKPNLMGPSFNIGSLQEGNHQANSDGVARLLFPFGDLNKFSSQNNAPTNTARSDHQVDSHQSIKGSSQDHHHHHHHQQQQQQGESGFWNGMLGGGTW